MLSDISWAFFWFASSILLYLPSHHCHCSLVVIVVVLSLSLLFPSPSPPSHACIVLVYHCYCHCPPVIHSCHPSVFIPPCHPIVIVINVPKRFVSNKKNRMRKKKEKTYLWPKRHPFCIRFLFILLFHWCLVLYGHCCSCHFGVAPVPIP